jgi:hypothetical protein
MSDVTRRFLVAVVAVMPAHRRAWGEALLAELDHVHTPRDRMRLVFAAVRVGLLPSAAAAGYGRVAGRAALTAAVAWTPLGATVYVSNVLFPTSPDYAPAVIAMFLYLTVMLMRTGAVARRASPRRGAPIIAGVAAGLIIAVLTISAFAIVDNVFLAAVSMHPEKISGLQASGMTSMRAYINSALRAAAPGEVLFLTIGGGLLAALGSTIKTSIDAPNTPSNLGTVRRLSADQAPRRSD